MSQTETSPMGQKSPQLDTKKKGMLMEEQELKVLNLIKDKDYAPMKAKEIAMIMHVPKSEYNELLRILGKLEMEMKIQKNRKNQYRPVDAVYYDGIYRKNQKGFGFVKIEDQEDEIYIAKENSKNALNGDRVLIEIIEEIGALRSFQLVCSYAFGVPHDE